VRVILGLALACVACRAPEPPTKGWQLTTDSVVRRALLTSAGVAILATDTAVIGVRDGREVWRYNVAHAPWLIALDDGTVLSRSDDGRVVALEAATGTVAWKLGVPIESETPLTAQDKDILGRFRYSAPRGAAVSGADRALMLVEDGRLYDLVPSQCVARTPRCSSLRGHIPVTFSGAVDLVDAGSVVVVSSVGEVLFTAPDGRIIARARVPGLFGGIATWPGAESATVALALDSTVVTLDLSRCKSAPPIALSAGCPECVSPPKGCVTASVAVAGVLPYPPALLGEGLVVNAVARTHVLGDAARALDLDGIGPVVAAPGGRARTVSAHATDRSLRLIELDATGVKREARLPFASPGLVISEEILLSVSGSKTLVAIGRDVALVEL